MAATTRKSGTRGKGVKVHGYTRVRFGRTERITPHKRGPRSPSPQGYKTGAQSKRRRHGVRGRLPGTTTRNS